MWGATLYTGILSGWTEMLLVLVLLADGNIIGNGNWFGPVALGVSVEIDIIRKW